MSEKENTVSCGCGCGEEHTHEHNHEECGCGEEHGHSHGECDCGCGEHDHEALVVELEDEHGNVVPCEVIDGFSYNDAEFALVQNPQDGSVFLFKVVGEGDEGELVVPEDEEFKAATAYYESTLEK
ncbi:Protein of unknown function [Clostridium acidisoli DSM 12555]|uniref:DUF1292 domain-containing protein n=1 Tax=Clostridium acidisoli DSM 12555 TaxID=1121291 RepID=A0A1W1X2U7_9CLOT|nr:DUF1292 domain-containing protein [Clostridium acidisoli]SMC18048.1 Protein of unknown function [Clostridium acidisoli DSM 12555]